MSLCAVLRDQSNYTGKLKCCLQNLEVEIPIDCFLVSQAPVLLYYGLSNFHQNHRRYVASRDDRQLYGTEGYGPLEISKAGTCDGFVPEGNQSTMGYAPCGAIANSLFNDSFTLQLLSLNASERNNSDSVVPLLKTGIAWQSDKQRFRNPSSFSNETWLAPPNWRKPVWLLDPENAANNGYLNEDLIVWMRTAQLATFRKLHRRIDHSADPFKSGLPVSSYVIFVNYCKSSCFFPSCCSESMVHSHTLTTRITTIDSAIEVIMFRT